MNILAIESSCDETSAAVVRDGRHVLSNAVLSQTELHALYGGVVPEVASRRHLETITGICEEAVLKASVSKRELDAVAVTNSPGLIGALLVGVGFAKAAAFSLGVPLIPVHHIRGHIAANYIAFPELEPPFTCLVASGGHTLILDIAGYTDICVLGGTRDDAAGEAFDKVARVLGLGYPGGALLDELAKTGDPLAYPLPRSKFQNAPLDMSFSGLKTAVINIVHNSAQKREPLDAASLAASFTAAVTDTLVPRLMSAAASLKRGKIAVAGGVAANSALRSALSSASEEAGIGLFLPPVSLCGDNAAMIGSQAYYEYLSGVSADMSLNAFATKKC